MPVRGTSSQGLREVHTLPQLVKYLRDDLGWPIEANSFEDLDEVVFDWGPEELGIDPESAAKIEYIKQLRPLEKDQPRGVFFVKFDTRQLPVVALRRILGKLVVSKRATARAAERPLWEMRDLVFISSYGEGDSRQLSFAYFQDAEHRHDLPTLKVLGWDNQDTPLHLDQAHTDLSKYLSWPESPKTLDEWRKNWSKAFQLRHREVISTSKTLSLELAKLARAIRDRIKMALAIETEKGPLTKLMKAFQQGLVHDLDAEGFADMYAQTIAYGLLSARIADPKRKTADDFSAHMRTSPFLRELMQEFLKAGGRQGKAGGKSRGSAGIDFDELGVSDVVELLDDANMEAVVLDFGDRNPQEDPVIHFYELFLKEYDARSRTHRGVFFTPRPVVAYIVRSVDEALRSQLGLVDGLADTASWADMTKRHKHLKVPNGVAPIHDFVQILDPATGTGTFLVEAIDLIYKTLVAKWKAERHDDKRINELWNKYVPRHLLTRLHGYELLMAPYSIAHLKIGLKLYETGYRFGSEERARVYLTNALEPVSDKQTAFEFLPALAHEAQAVNEIKQRQWFTVVIGNPPYFGEAGRGGDWIAGLLRGTDMITGRRTHSYFQQGGQPLNERTTKWLNDDYVKFIRQSEWLIDNAGLGVLGIVSNHSYLDNPTFRGMRESLLASFSRIRILDLHGNANKKEVSPDGCADKNVFDILQGVAIAIMSKTGDNDVARKVIHAELWGSRETKYSELTSATLYSNSGQQVPAREPLYYFAPDDSTLRAEYEAGWSIENIFPVHGVGMTTARDHVVIDFDKEPLLERASQFRDSKLPDAELCEALGIPEKKGWNVARARALIRSERDLAKHLQKILYRPFDVRMIFYHDSLVWRTVKIVMRHMLEGRNRGLITTRQTKDLWGVTATRFVIGHKTCAAYDVNSLFPLYLQRQTSEMFSEGQDGRKWDRLGRTPNLDYRFVANLERSVGLKFEHGGPTDQGTFDADDVFNYAYAVFHSPSYRRRYAGFLKSDFPRLPLTGNLNLFRPLARLGGELSALHLLESPRLAQPITEFIGGRHAEVEKVSWSRNTVWLDMAQTTGFHGVRQDVWNWHIGGYQVCEKWLKDRKGRKLSKDDITHYQKIVVALSETIRLMTEIDKLIDKHGGWPGAFATGQTAEAAEPARMAAEPRSKYESH